MLGSIADAEDAVQERSLRWHRAERDKVSNPRAFLMTTTTRICLDMLTSARARYEEYIGPWLPEPVVDTAAVEPFGREIDVSAGIEIAQIRPQATLLALQVNLVKPSGLHGSEPTPLWTKKRPSESYFFLISSRRG